MVLPSVVLREELVGIGAELFVVVIIEMNVAVFVNISVSMGVVVAVEGMAFFLLVQ